jgi:hypothetical protein
MAEKTLHIEVQEDHLERISQTKKPLLVVAELVWNALDADASRVTISLVESGLGTLDAIEVADNGHSILYCEIDSLFTKLGGSWKQRQRKTRELGRLLHGKEGRGRFRAFALGRVVDWYLCYSDDGQLWTYRVEMIREHLRNVRIGDQNPAPANARRGTVVRVSELLRDFRTLRDPAAAGELSLIFALYLRQYRTVEIIYSGTKVDPAASEDRCETIELSAIELLDEGKKFPVTLEIVWNGPLTLPGSFTSAPRTASH